MDDVTYFDHAACAPLERAALEAMLNVGSGLLGNPDSVHLPGRKARAVLDEARASVASFLGADPSELSFFGSATAALQAAVAAACCEREGLLVSSVLEHPSVIDAVAQQERVGRTVQLLVARDGEPSLEDSMSSFDQASVVVLSACNHELGNAPDLSKARAASRDALWIVDAVQAAPWLDLLSLRGVVMRPTATPMLQRACLRYRASRRRQADGDAKRLWRGQRWRRPRVECA